MTSSQLVVWLVWAVLMVPAVAVFGWAAWAWVRVMRGRRVEGSTVAVSTPEHRMIGEVQAVVGRHLAMGDEANPRLLAHELVPLCPPHYPRVLEAAQQLLGQQDRRGWRVAALDLDFGIITSYSGFQSLDGFDWGAARERLRQSIVSHDAGLSDVAAQNAHDLMARGFLTDPLSVATFGEALGWGHNLHSPPPEGHRNLRDMLERHGG
jgi:hypothetical protein